MDYDHIDKRVGDLAAEVRQGFGAVDERIDGLAQEVRHGFAETNESLRRYMDIVAERLETRFQQTVDGQFALRDRVNVHDHAAREP